MTILDEVRAERARQTDKHGDQSHLPDGTSPPFYRMKADRYRKATDRRAAAGSLTFLDILFEEVYEAAAESDPAALRAELVQVAAVAVQWIEAIDGRCST